MPTQKRKTHRKSRAGCANCKIRRIKCDETKPNCQKCIDFSVSCTYDATTNSSDSTTTQLHHAGESSFQLTTTTTTTQQPTPPSSTKDPSPPPSIIPTMLSHPLTLHQSPQLYHLTPTDLSILHRYQTRTVLTIGTARTVHIYRDKTFSLALTCPYLTHIILTLTLMHDRSLSGEREPSTKESWHWYHGTALFHAKLQGGVVAEGDKDGMWGTAALLGCCTLADVAGERPEEVWPLREGRVEDLGWLRMSEGKKEVWRLTDPLREGSVWREALRVDLETWEGVGGGSDGTRELDELFPFLIRVFDVHGDEGVDPYATASSILVRLLALECSHATVMYFLSFLGHMDPKFRRLMHDKDPKALLLVSWWYAKMLPYGVWWLKRRATLECRAIVLYLERNSRDQEILKLLDFPRVACGLDQNQPGTAHLDIV